MILTSQSIFRSEQLRNSHTDCSFVAGNGAKGEAVLDTSEVRGGLGWRQVLRARADSVVRATSRRVPVAARRRALYALNQHRWLNLNAPRTFNEKVNWRMVHDRRALIAETCDKLKAKEYAASRGIDPPRVIWSGTDLSELESLDLPEHWVLKPNHRTGLVHIGRGKANTAELATLTRGWLDEMMWSVFGEWAYSQADRCYVLEERVGQPGVDLPDYKFFVFSGAVDLIEVDTERQNNHCARMYTADWHPLDVQGQLVPLGPIVEKPRCLDAMLEAAEKLGADFDFIRVDLYEYADQIWFGELTPYPAGGLERFVPHFLDEQLGRLWNLPQDISHPY
jgi:TupA-like ATPgrasp